MKKNAIVFILMLALVVSAFAGCTGGGTPAPASQQSTASTAQSTGDTTPAAEGEVTKFDDVRLTMLICWNGGFKTAKDQYNNPVATAIRDKIGVTVEFEGIMMSETEKLNMMFASGDMPDMVNAPYWGGNAGETAVIKKAAREGRLLPIDDMLAKYPNVARSYDIGVISQKYLETDLLFDGVRYLVPQETAGNVDNITNWAYGAFVRGDVPEALGVDPASIKTFDQLYDFMVKARDHGFKDINGNPCIVATTFHEGWDYGRYTESFSEQKLTSYNLKEDGSVTYDWMEDNWMERHVRIWKLVNEGLLDKECFKQSGNQAEEKVGNGSALFTAAQYSSSIKATKLTNMYASNPEMRYVPIGPMNDAQGNPLFQVESMGRSGSPVVFFPTTCSNLDAAFAYLDYVNTEEGLMLAQYGIEGETYTLNDQGQPRLAAPFLERKANGDGTWEDDMREYGALYIPGRTIFANMKLTWWGETDPGEAEAAVPELEAYKLARPAKQLSGYPINAFESQFPEYERLIPFFDGQTEKEYRERAYFASTEAEAREILQSFRDYQLSREGGLFNEFLVYMAEVAKSRDDIAF